MVTGSKKQNVVTHLIVVKMQSTNITTKTEEEAAVEMKWNRSSWQRLVPRMTRE